MGDALWTSEDAAAATNGRAAGNWSITGLSIDTRSLRDGDLFVPLKDARDGHDFIPQARQAGAGAVMSERGDESAPALIIDDAVEALRGMAIAARNRSKAVRIGVTGSVGKTSLKEAIAVICETQGKTHKSLKSFNNHWGVPLTLASMPASTGYGVFELGMNHAGELAGLSPLVSPHIAVITKIAPAHLAHFENVDAIAKAKAEIFEGMEAGATAVLNADDTYFGFLSGIAKDKGLRILSFGAVKDADVRFANMTLLPGSIQSDLIVGGTVHSLKMNLGGAHWVSNGACAVAAALAAGINVTDSLAALETLMALSGRGERIETSLGGANIVIVDESYNANPESMRAAIQSLKAEPGRKLAVLGDMFELGQDELALHAELSEPLERAGFERVILVGECMRVLRGALPRSMRGVWAANSDQAFEALEAELKTGDTVLIKGSNATGLSNLVTRLKNNKKESAHAL